MNQKRTKGFTLIELLAVIVILAIIALIAVPVILNIIDKANKSAFKDTAYGVLTAAELYFAEQLLEANGMSEEKTFEFPNAEGLKIKGQVPQSGTMTVTKDGKVSLAVINGRYCVTKGFDDNDVTITEDIENCVESNETTEIVLGQSVFFNPVQNDTCTNYVEANSTAGVKDDKCMRWYVYKIDGDNVGLILDHNTTAVIDWNETGDVEDGPTILMEQLKADTADQGWKVSANIIAIEDVLNLSPFYYKLDEECKENWLDSYSTLMTPFIGDVAANVGNSDDYPTEKEYRQAIYDYMIENYTDVMLPIYMHEDLLNNFSDDSYGYWLTESYEGTIFYVNGGGFLYINMGIKSGVRPVISLSKNLIS